MNPAILLAFLVSPAMVLPLFFLYFYLSEKLAAARALAEAIVATLPSTVLLLVLVTAAS